MSEFRCSRRVGKYNWADPSQVSACLSVHLPEGAPSFGISDTVPVDSEYDVDTDDPFAMADAIRKSINRYWIDTSRAKTLAALDWIDANRGALRLTWLRRRAERAQEEAAECAAKASLAAAEYEEALEKAGEA